MIKVFLSPKNTANLMCRACGRAYEADMTAYLDAPAKAAIRATCKCGHTWRFGLEKRRFFRKGVTLPGTFRYHNTGQKVTEGMMTVLDISRTGMKIAIHGRHTLKDGDWIEVEFRLNNTVRTMVNRIVNIKNISNDCIGASFRDIKQFDPALGFYMLEHSP